MRDLKPGVSASGDHGLALGVARILPILSRVQSPAASFPHRLAALTRRAAQEWEKMDALPLPTIPRPVTLAAVAAEPVKLNTQLGT